MKLNIQNHWYQRWNLVVLIACIHYKKVHGIWIHIHFHCEPLVNRNWHAHTKIMNLSGNILICIDYYIIIKCHSIDHLVLPNLL
jgi:hypothetical protein